MKKVCQVMFSTNRVDYLNRTLSSIESNLSYEGLDVHKVFIDDYPMGRDDTEIIDIASRYGFTEILLHYKNLGITSTWDEFFSLIKDRDYDYIFHHEDDVELTQKIKLLDMIELLDDNKNLYQVQLKRNNWYPHESNKKYEVNESDIKYRNFFYEKQTTYFWMLFSVYPKWISNIDYKKESGWCPSESVITWVLNKQQNMSGAILKAQDGGILVNHFGETSKGKRVNENEPGWESFKGFKADKLYYSRNGQEIEGQE